MKKIRRARIITLVLGIFCCISVLVGTPALAVTAIRGLYYLVVPLVLVVIHGFFGIPLYFRAYALSGLDLRVLSAYDEAEGDVATISEATGLTEEAVALRIAGLVERGIIKK